jgi:hypothetical protein
MTATTATAPVTAKQQSVLDELINNGPGTAAELADRMGVMVSQKSTQQLASSLLTKGLVTKDGMTYSAVIADEAEHTADLDDALAAAAARQEAGKPLEFTPSGKVAKMVRITLDLRITTDGRWMVQKNGEGETPWTLFAVTGNTATVKGQFATCTAALAPEVISA